MISRFSHLCYVHPSNTQHPLNTSEFLLLRRYYKEGSSSTSPIIWAGVLQIKYALCFEYQQFLPQALRLLLPKPSYFPSPALSNTSLSWKTMLLRALELIDLNETAVPHLFSRWMHPSSNTHHDPTQPTPWRVNIIISRIEAAMYVPSQSISFQGTLYAVYSQNILLLSFLAASIFVL